MPPSRRRHRLLGEALGPGGRGVEGGGEVVDGGFRVAVAQCRRHLREPGVVPPDLRPLLFRPLLVLPLVLGQLTLPLRLCGLRRVPVVLEPGARLGLCLRPALCGPTALRLIVVGVRHGYRLGERPRRERLQPFGAGEGCGPERRCPAARGQQPFQGLDLRVQFLRAPSGLRLALLPVGRLLFPLAARHLPLVRALPALVLALLPRLFLRLTLLLALCLGPDPGQPVGATTHTLQALPPELHRPRDEAPPPQPDVTGRLYPATAPAPTAGQRPAHRCRVPADSEPPPSRPARPGTGRAGGRRPPRRRSRRRPAGRGLAGRAAGAGMPSRARAAATTAFGGSPEQEAAGHRLTSGARNEAPSGNAGGTAVRPGTWHRPPREAGAACPPGPDP